MTVVTSAFASPWATDPPPSSGLLDRPSFPYGERRNEQKAEELEGVRVQPLALPDFSPNFTAFSLPRDPTFCNPRVWPQWLTFTSQIELVGLEAGLFVHSSTRPTDFNIGLLQASHPNVDP